MLKQLTRFVSILLTLSLALSPTVVFANEAGPLDIGGFEDLAPVPPPTSTVTTSSWHLPLTDWLIAPEDPVSFAPWSVAGLGPPTEGSEGLRRPPVVAGTSGWIPAKAPGTVLGALLDAGIYDSRFRPNNDGERCVYFDANMMEIDRDDFKGWWWYRIEFDVPAAEIGNYFNLDLRQISYQGEIWVNGTQVHNNNLHITDIRELQNAMSRYEPATNLGVGSWPRPPLNFNNIGIGGTRGSGSIHGEPTATDPRPGDFIPSIPDTDGTSGGFPSGSTAWASWTETPGWRSSVGEFGDNTFCVVDDQGRQIGYSNRFIGTYRNYNVDVTPQITAGTNVVMIRVKRMFNVADFGPFYHDWHPAAPDNGMGLNGPIKIQATGPARLGNPMAAAEVLYGTVTPEGNGNVDLSFYVTVSNPSAAPLTGAVINARVRDPRGYIVPGFDNIVHTITDTVPAGYYNWDVPVLEGRRLNNAELWWTNGMGSQPLYSIEYTITVDDRVSDTLTHRFGIRQLRQEINSFGTGANAIGLQVYINHQPIILAGGGFSALDMFYRHSDLANRNFIDIVTGMGHNFWRDEGKFFSEALYDLMDEYGILNMTGYMCCDRNEAVQVNSPGSGGGTPHIEVWSQAERFIIYETTYSQALLLRRYASAWSWLFASDATMANQSGTGNIRAYSQQNVVRKMLQIMGRTRWHQVAFVLDNAHTGVSQLVGRVTGVRMASAYDTHPAGFFWTDVTAAGGGRGIQGFNSEGAGGLGMPVTHTVRRMIPDENNPAQRSFMWPYNQGALPEDGNGTGVGPGNYNKWNYHMCRAGTFERLDNANNAIESAFGPSYSVEEYNIRAQLFMYDFYRAMHEALNFRRFNRSMGFVNWMLNGPRPGMHWNQFDYWFNPHGATHGTAQGMTPVHIIYNPYDREIYAMNTTRENLGEVTATLRMFDIYGNQINVTLRDTFNLGPDGITGFHNPDA